MLDDPRDVDWEKFRTSQRFGGISFPLTEVVKDNLKAGNHKLFSQVRNDYPSGAQHMNRMGQS